jgi:hypothetical protein
MIEALHERDIKIVLDIVCNHSSPQLHGRNWQIPTCLVCWHLIATSTVQLKLKASLDYESKSSYNIRLETTDADGLSLGKAVTLNANNIN